MILSREGITVVTSTSVHQYKSNYYMHQGLSPYLVSTEQLNLKQDYLRLVQTLKVKYTYFIGLKILVMFCSVHFIYYKSLVQVGNKNFKICALSAFNNTEYEIYQDVVDM